jgi:hypothetical protein
VRVHGLVFFPNDLQALAAVVRDLHLIPESHVEADVTFATDLAAAKWMLLVALPVGPQGPQGIQVNTGGQGIQGNTGATGASFSATGCVCTSRSATVHRRVLYRFVSSPQQAACS